MKSESPGVNTPGQQVPPGTMRDIRPTNGKDLLGRQQLELSPTTRSEGRSSNQSSHQ
jgi:hypothetical protein